jgi:hypothetical protein
MVAFVGFEVCSSVRRASLKLEQWRTVELEAYQFTHDDSGALLAQASPYPCPMKGDKTGGLTKGAAREDEVDTTVASSLRFVVTMSKCTRAN